MKNEISLYQRNTEAVMAIENRAREICEPVSSKDTSNLIPNDKTFWPEVEPEITLEPEVISNNNAIEAEDDLFSWA